MGSIFNYIKANSQILSSLKPSVSSPQLKSLGHTGSQMYSNITLIWSIYLEVGFCNYCGELDDLTHIFVTCSRLSGLFQLTQSLIRKLTPTIDKIHVWCYIIGIPASAGLDVNVWRLCNWIFAQAKIAIVYSRFNKYKSSGTQCVVTLFKAKVISRVNVEYQFARFQNTVCNFFERWNTYNVLGKVENDHIVFNL